MLALFADVLRDDCGQEYLRLLDALLSRHVESATAAFARVTELLAAGRRRGAVDADGWQVHLLDRVLGSENPLCTAAQGNHPPPAGLLSQAVRELRILQTVFVVGGSTLRSALAEIDPATAPLLSDWREIMPGGHGDCDRLVDHFVASDDWGTLADSLVAWYRRRGSGIFRFRAFRWLTSPPPGHLEGIAHPDPQRLEDLIGYDRERLPVIHNSAQFVAGLPANNVLIAGDRGTGKSSTVKALLNEFAGRRLRLVEMSKEHLRDLPTLYETIRERPERFLLFVDDLSFEEDDAEYKALKAALEGGVIAKPDNLVVYATSNRRNLVRERFADREAVNDDPHRRDTYEEKLSLVDRFGIRVVFLAPDQERYVEIATTLARRAGIQLPVDELRRRAIEWAHAHNGRSGRTARQFVNALLGEQGLKDDQATARAER